MPYYLSPIEETTIRIMAGKFLRRPRHSDIPGANWICLKDRALLWLPSSVADPLLIEIVTNKTDKPAVAKRIAIQTFLGDRIISDSWNLMDIIKDILLNPMAQKWGALQPSFEKQRFEIWLGPPEDRLFWSQSQLVAKKSKQYSDNFNREAANLDGSAFSDGSGVAWDEIAGTLWTGANNRAEANNIPEWTDEIAVTDADLDTDSMWGESNLAVFTRAASSDLNAAIWAKTNTGHSSGYIFYVGVDQAASAYRVIYAVFDDSVLDSDSTQTTSGILRCTVDGSSISAQVGGVTVLGPVTNSTEAGGSGNRRCGIGCFGGDAITNDIAFDDFVCQDLSFGEVIGPFPTFFRP